MSRIFVPSVLLVVLVVGAMNASAATVTVRVTVPEATPAGDTVYLTGDFQGWRGDDPDFALEDRGGGVHVIRFEVETGTRIAFRFTRGSDATAERGPGGEEVRRTLRIDGDRSLDLRVAAWADGVETVERTLTGDVTEHTVAGLLDGRRVWVYLPPGYHESDQRYPVHYMLDGQNVFDAATSFVGEWQVDETCERLIAAGEIAPIVVVALDNGGTRRVHEYTPTVDRGRGVGGGADAHFAAIREVLMPWVEANFRVRTGSEHTGFSGSSLGGLMSLVAAFEHADVFGRIGAISPSIWWDDRVILRRIRTASKPDVRLWVDMGTDEGSTRQSDQAYVGDLRALEDLLVDAGFDVGEDLRVFVDAGARHNEQWWGARYDRVLRFLYPPE